MTAAEHKALLSKDPTYLAMRAKQEAELAAFVGTFADEEALIAGDAAAVFVACRTAYHIPAAQSLPRK